MKTTKTSYRNRLQSSTMTTLMTVQLHTAGVKDYDPTPAIHQWNKHHHRCPSFLAKKKRRCLPLNRRINCDIEEQVEKRQVSASQEEEPDLEDEIYSDYESDYESELSGLSDVNSDFSDAELL